MTVNTEDRRCYQRVGFDALIVLTQAGSRWKTTLLDLSLHGLLVARPENWAGDSCLPFQACITLSNETKLQMEIQLAHEEAGTLGFHWRHIDVESFSHLRRLLELNLGDPALLERELSALIGS